MAGTHGNHLRHRRTTPQPPRRIGRATEFTGNNLLLGAPFMAKSVLVVDDSASVRQVVGIALKSAGYDVIEASDGKDALGKLNGQKVHLIISDVNMPNMDGITFVKEVKKLRTEEGRGGKEWVSTCR